MRQEHAPFYACTHASLPRTFHARSTTPQQRACVPVPFFPAPVPRPQVKSGNDDMRQDAVMQQFFWLVNQFLRQEERTARRALFIRPYKVRGLPPLLPLLLIFLAVVPPHCHHQLPPQPTHPPTPPPPPRWSPSAPPPACWSGWSTRCPWQTTCWGPTAPPVRTRDTAGEGPTPGRSAILRWLSGSWVVVEVVVGWGGVGGWMGCVGWGGGGGGGGLGLTCSSDLEGCLRCCRRPCCATAAAPPVRGPSPAAQLVKTLQSQPKPEQLRAAFEEVCARFPPAMHHFFLENFRDPGGAGNQANQSDTQCFQSPNGSFKFLNHSGRGQASGLQHLLPLPPLP